jgi:hypothetical protein
MSDRQTLPKVPFARAASRPPECKEEASFYRERSAIHRRRPLPARRDPLASLVEVVAMREDDPRRER